uniref:Uncharacterized protein n=2 Tax=Panagrolaimus sp. JU765 TaxID=591449 RepID=A0AC34QEE0_9BILA
MFLFGQLLLNLIFGFCFPLIVFVSCTKTSKKTTKSTAPLKADQNAGQVSLVTATSGGDPTMTQKTSTAASAPRNSETVTPGQVLVSSELGSTTNLTPESEAKAKTEVQTAESKNRTEKPTEIVAITGQKTEQKPALPKPVEDLEGSQKKKVTETMDVNETLDQSLKKVDKKQRDKRFPHLVPGTIEYMAAQCGPPTDAEPRSGTAWFIRDRMSNLSIIPTLTRSQVRELCSGINLTEVEPIHHQNHERPSSFVVWCLGLTVVTIVTLCAIVGIGLMRIMSKAAYHRFITFFVALGVGSLSGTAVFHLIPQAFGLVNSDPEHKYIFAACSVLEGIYAFFVVDKLLKIIFHIKCKNKAMRNPIRHPHKDLPTEKADEESLVKDGRSIELQKISDENTADASLTAQAHSLCAHDHDVHFKEGDSPLKVVALMIIFGDGLHNFLDGISIGASFSESITSGLSISLAVIFEEFPHELGDIAILISAGMSIKQALIYNLLSAMSCYIGFGIGVFFGNLDENIEPVIFALAAGMFLYISISCMMPDMKLAMDDGLQVSLRSGLEIFVLQIVGVFTGLSLMYFMAVHGEKLTNLIIQ